MKHSFESASSSAERSEQGEHKRKLILTKLGGDALNAANAAPAGENPVPAPAAENPTGEPAEKPAPVETAASLYDNPFDIDAAPLPGESKAPATAETKKPTLSELLDGVETRPRLTEAERRLQADREGVDAALRMFGSAAHEKLSPDDRLEVELSLDIFDEISEQLDDAENDKNAHEILEKMTQKYDRLARKAPTPDRRQKYFVMAQIANKQKDRFGDWKAIDAAKNRPKSAAEKALDDLMNII